MPPMTMTEWLIVGNLLINCGVKVAQAWSNVSNKIKAGEPVTQAEIDAVFAPVDYDKLVPSSTVIQRMASALKEYMPPPPQIAPAN